MIVGWRHLVLILVTLSPYVAATVQLDNPQIVRRSPHIPSVTLPQLTSAPGPRTPPLAATARIEGPVRLIANINEMGEVASLSVQSGHPFLVAAAVEGVKEYKYRPGTVNGVAAQFFVTVTVEFRIASPPLKLVPIR
jgi:TonB family protein